MRALLIEPFFTFGFMRTALVACVGLALANAPVGVLLMQRRMSLTADILSHTVMPGAALGFLLAGYSVFALSLGGIVAGGLVGLLATLSLRREQSDSMLAVLYLLSLAGGVLLVTLRGSNIDLMHVLFGTVLAVNTAGLVFIACVASVTLLGLAVIWRPLAVESFDPMFLRAIGGGGQVFGRIFIGILVLCLVAGFQAFGTLLAIGPVLLPAIAARRVSRELRTQIVLAFVFGVAADAAGLLISFHLNVPSGPAIVLSAGAVYGLCLLPARERKPAPEIALPTAAE